MHRPGPPIWGMPQDPHVDVYHALVGMYGMSWGLGHAPIGPRPLEVGGSTGIMPLTPQLRGQGLRTQTPVHDPTSQWGSVSCPRRKIHAHDVQSLVLRRELLKRVLFTGTTISTSHRRSGKCCLGGTLCRCR